MNVFMLLALVNAANLLIKFEYNELFILKYKNEFILNVIRRTASKLLT